MYQTWMFCACTASALVVGFCQHARGLPCLSLAAWGHRLDIIIDLQLRMDGLARSVVASQRSSYIVLTPRVTIVSGCGRFERRMILGQAVGLWGPSGAALETRAEQCGERQQSQSGGLVRPSSSSCARGVVLPCAATINPCTPSRLPGARRRGGVAGRVDRRAQMIARHTHDNRRRGALICNRPCK